MQRTANRILSALIALVMILSMLPATVLAASETEAVLTGWNVVLGENIGVNFLLNKEGYTVTTTVDGVEVQPEISGSKVTVNVSAAQMTDTIGLTVKDGETVVKEGEYSVRQYAETILTGEYDDYVKQLVKEMLNYGAAAQTYFAHNTGDLANRDYVLAPTATVPAETTVERDGTLPDGLTLYGMTLIFQSRTAVRFYFKTTGNIADYTFKVGETLYTPVQKQGTYYIEVGNINPQNLHQPVTVSVNGGAFTVSYSPLDYIVRQYNKQDSSDKLKALVEAMYCYHRQARYYVGMIPVGALQANVNGHGAYGEGIYFSTLETNNAPYGANGAWDFYYDSASVDCLKLVRNGETISVGLTGRNTICKFSANDYALRLYDHTIGDYAPFTTDDMFIIEGAFTHQDSMTTLNIERTYIYYDGSAWVFSAEEPVFEPETESPFTFDKGVFSADIFNNRNNGLSVSVENKQLKLQNPAGADTWLWIKQDLPAGAVVTMDVTFSGDGMGIYGYGSNANGDPMTEGEPTATIPQEWFWGQGGTTSGSYTFNIYEDCHGLSLNLRFAGSAETAIRIDNVVIILPPETQSPFTFDCGSFSAEIFNNRNNGLSVSVENKQLKLQQPAGASNWLWIKQNMTAGTVVTMDVTFSGEGMNIFGYGSNANGDPITSGAVKEPAVWYNGQGGSTSGSYTFNIYEDCYGLSLMLGFAGSTETAIYIDNVVITPPANIVIDGGNMTENAEGWDAAGDIFFTLAENALPLDDNMDYPYTAESGVIKLVRGGSEYAMVGAVVKFDIAYYLDLSGSENLPLQDNDYLIVEGNFVNADNGYTLNIAKTYVLVDGEDLIYSTTAPVIVSTYEVGVLNSHGAGVETGDNGIQAIYATSIATDATSGDWSIEYTPVAAENYKLIRDGVTYNVGRPGEGTLVMFGQTEYYLKQKNNTFDSSLLPLRKGDVLVVEGNWSCNQDAASVINITPTYILITGESSVKFMASMPNIVKISVLKESQNARAGSGFYATADANSAPLNGDWSLRYVAQSADAVKYVSGGTTTNVADTNGEMIAKFTETDYWFEGSTLGGTYASIKEGDMYIVDGLFYNAANNVYIDIDTTYIKFTASDELFGSTEMDAAPAYEMGVLSNHNAGVRVNNNAIDGVYAIGAAGTGAAYNTDWSYDYAPVRAENFKLIRNGVTYNVGVPATRTLVMFEDGQLFLDIHAGTFADTSLLPLQKYDILVLEGKFYCRQVADSVINITTTYILLGDKSATLHATMPEVIKPYEVGVLKAHTAGVNVDSESGNIKGIYATCTATDAAYESEWKYEYTPVSAENYKLIRNGVTYNVGQVGAGTLVLYSPTDMYLKQEGHTVGDGSLLPLQDGDILVVEGEWRCNQVTSSVINITTTYITVSETNNSAVFSAEDPRIIHVGTMYTHEAGYSTSGDGNISGIYFMNDSNVVPADEAWNVRYKATDASNVKLIRDGATTDIAVVGANTIVKISDQAGWLCLESSSVISTYPIKVGDVLIVEGAFTNDSNGYTMVIDKTYIIVGENGAVTFTTHYEQTDDFGAIVLPTIRDTLTFGTWAGSYHHFTDERLAELKNAGITKIIGVNTDQIGTDNVSGWLDRVYSYGISVVIDLRSWDGSTVPSYASHPGVIGFLMYDEPSPDDFDKLEDLKAKFDASAMADKLFYVNLFPEYVDDKTLGASWWDQLVGNNPDYDEDYITAFLSALDIKVLSWDNYSLLESSGIRTDYFHNFEVMASKGKTMWYTMLSAGHSAGSATYATPTAAQLRWQMAVAMTYGVQNIDHYVYYSHEDGYSCMLQNVDGVYSTTALYNDILTVDNEYLAWDHIFMAYDWQGVGVYDTGSSNAMLTSLENKLNLANYGLTVTSSNEDLLVGVFDHNGGKAYMITNAGSAGSTTVSTGKSFTMNDANVTLTLSGGNYKCVAVIDNGQIRYVAVQNNTVTIPVSAYEGVFVIPVLS